MAELFIRMILGHLAGDYLFQSQKMAINKSKPGLNGLIWSLFHCGIYTFNICLFATNFQPIFILLVFLTHWPIDRFALAVYWLRMIGGRDLYFPYFSKQKYGEVTAAQIIDLGFACVVYAVVDNTLHLLLLYLVALYSR